jgi:hypothetical protein
LFFELGRRKTSAGGECDAYLALSPVNSLSTNRTTMSRGPFPSKESSRLSNWGGIPPHFPLLSWRAPIRGREINLPGGRPPVMYRVKEDGLQRGLARSLCVGALGAVLGFLPPPSPLEGPRKRYEAMHFVSSLLRHPPANLQHATIDPPSRRQSSKYFAL